MDNLEQLAPLDSPFAEASLARFAHYFRQLERPTWIVEVMVAGLQAVIKRGTL
jgi:hypothetical protein